MAELPLGKSVRAATRNATFKLNLISLIVVVMIAMLIVEHLILVAETCGGGGGGKKGGKKRGGKMKGGKMEFKKSNGPFYNKKEKKFAHSSGPSFVTMTRDLRHKVRNSLASRLYEPAQAPLSTRYADRYHVDDYERRRVPYVDRSQWLPPPPRADRQEPYAYLQGVEHRHRGREPPPTDYREFGPPPADYSRPTPEHWAPVEYWRAHDYRAPSDSYHPTRYYYGPAGREEHYARPYWQ